MSAESDLRKEPRAPADRVRLARLAGRLGQCAGRQEVAREALLALDEMLGVREAALLRRLDIHLNAPDLPVTAESITADHAGRGLRGMRERVAMYSGTLDAGAPSEGGWKVVATLVPSASAEVVTP